MLVPQTTFDNFPVDPNAVRLLPSEERCTEKKFVGSKVLPTVGVPARYC